MSLVTLFQLNLGPNYRVGTGTVSAGASVAGVGAALAVATGVVGGSAGVSGSGAALSVSTGTVSASTSITGVGGALWASTGAVGASSTVLGVSAALKVATGSVTGFASVSGIAPGGVTFIAAPYTPGLDLLIESTSPEWALRYNLTLKRAFAASLATDLSNASNIALSNYANDTAAAAGGVPIGGLYRNGSVLSVRVT
jgi:hypothetical protein